jgi:hypothetical protein
MRLARIPIGLTGLFIDQQFGLLPNAPVYLVALSSLVAFARQQRRLALEMLAIATPYVIAVAAFHMWWAGLSSPARFLVPVLLPMAVPIAVCWRRQASAAGRAAMLALVAASVGITAALTCAGDGSLLYNTRDGYARWLDWIAPAVNLAHALPSLFQGGVATAWAQAAMWCAALAAGWYGLRILERRSVSSFLAVPLVAIAVASLGASGGWTVSGHTAIEPGSSAVAMLRTACGRDRALVRVAPFAWSVSRRDDAAFGVQDAGRRPMAAGGPLWTGRDMPPGRYRVLLDTGLNVTGELTIALGKPDATLQQCAFAEHRPGTTDCIVDLPAGATWLWMTPDSAMRASIEGLRLQPISQDRSDMCALRADRAVVTPAGVMFAEKGSVYAEPAGLWVIGGRMARLTIRPREQGNLVLRNGPTANLVRVATRASDEEHRLAPGELITIRLYTPPAGGVLPVTIASAAGVRPADLEAGNRDLRVLGVWVELRSRKQ